MLLAVLEHLSAHMQSPRETIEKILFTAMGTESTLNASLAFAAHLMGGSSCFLPISYCSFMRTDGWEGLPEEQKGLIPSLSPDLPLFPPGCWLVGSKVMDMEGKTGLAPMLKEVILNM